MDSSQGPEALRALPRPCLQLGSLVRTAFSGISRSSLALPHPPAISTMPSRPGRGDAGVLRTLEFTNQGLSGKSEFWSWFCSLTLTKHSLGFSV